jgi:hypothetical protein
MTMHELRRGVLRKQWDATIPEFLPGDYQFDIWLNRFPVHTIEFAIEKLAKFATARRNAGKPMDSDYMIRYASACMRNRTVEDRENAERRARQACRG